MQQQQPWPDDLLFRVLAVLIEYGVTHPDHNERDSERFLTVRDQLDALDPDGLRITLSRFIRDTYLTDERLARGAGIADALRAIDWLAEMGIDLSRALPVRTEARHRLRLPS